MCGGERVEIDMMNGGRERGGERKRKEKGERMRGERDTKITEERRIVRHLVLEITNSL